MISSENQKSGMKMGKHCRCPGRNSATSATTTAGRSSTASTLPGADQSPSVHVSTVTVLPSELRVSQLYRDMARRTCSDATGASAGAAGAWDCSQKLKHPWIHPSIASVQNSDDMLNDVAPITVLTDRYRTQACPEWGHGTPARGPNELE